MLFGTEIITKVDYGKVTQWKEGDNIEILPRDGQYQMCFMINSMGKFEEYQMLYDDNFIILLKVDVKNPTKGQVHSKIKLKQVVDTGIDRKDNRNLIIAVLSDQSP